MSHVGLSLRLAEWRAAERRRDATAPDSEARGEAEEEVRRARLSYEIEARTLGPQYEAFRRTGWLDTWLHGPPRDLTAGTGSTPGGEIMDRTGRMREPERG